MTNLEKIIFSKEWSMFFNIPKIKIIDNLFIVSCLLLKHFDEKELKRRGTRKVGLGNVFFHFYYALSFALYLVLTS